MKAAICRSFGAPLVIENLTIASPQGRAVKVAVEASAICHSDITFIEGGWGGTPPVLLGHEAAGTVLEVGADATQFSPGDRVVITLMRSCGSCPSCLRELEAICETPPSIGGGTIGGGGIGDGGIGNGAISGGLLHDAAGNSITPLMACGTFAEEVLVHERQCVALPPDMRFDVASLLGCGVITGFGAVMRVGKVRPGEHVAIIGLGGVGINAVQAARLAKAGAITAIDTDASKRDLALALGATAFCNPLEDTPPPPPGGGFDAVFVAVGSARVIEGAVDLIRPGGRVVVLGMPREDDLARLDMAAIAGKAKTIMGTKMGSAMIREDIPALIKLYQGGKIDLDRLISHRYPFDDINTAIETAKSPGSMRVILTFDKREKQ